VACAVRQARRSDAVRSLRAPVRGVGVLGQRRAPPVPTAVLSAAPGWDVRSSPPARAFLVPGTKEILMPTTRSTRWPADLPARGSGQRVFGADLENRERAAVRVVGGELDEAASNGTGDCRCVARSSSLGHPPPMAGIAGGAPRPSASSPAPVCGASVELDSGRARRTTAACRRAESWRRAARQRDARLAPRISPTLLSV
jgi:hypothetical protein